MAGKTIDLATFEDGPIGTQILYFQEPPSQPLTLAEAIERFGSNEVSQSSGQSISLGIGVDPVWMKVSVLNPEPGPQAYRLAIETPWLDFIDTWLVHQGSLVRQVTGGDGVAFEDRPMAHRVYAFEHHYAPGSTELYIRVQTKGPMALPVRFSNADTAIKRDLASGYEYGFLYGLMAALALYNLLLYLVIRQREYGLYSLYLAGFIANSLSYTGQIYTVITVDLGPYFQDWTDIFLMITYSIAGLHFARELLNTKQYAPRLDAFTKWTTIVIPFGMLIGAVFNLLGFSMLLAFLLNSGFVILFVAMGVVALIHKVPSSRLFVICSVTAALCITVSTLAVAGVMPYNDFTFKAIEVGMAFEAVFLALILAQRFRTTQQEKLIAERYARTDPLTNLKNRRGFTESSLPLWENMLRYEQHISVVILDIDHFKTFNDQYGHACGDLVLKEVSQALLQSARKGDVLARWGGEEFILLLPQTDVREASVQGERLRIMLSDLKVQFESELLDVTASFGVAGSQGDHTLSKMQPQVTLETLISLADEALYQAKNDGRNQVIQADIVHEKTLQGSLL